MQVTEKMTKMDPKAALERIQEILNDTGLLKGDDLYTVCAKHMHPTPEEEALRAYCEGMTLGAIHNICAIVRLAL